MVVDDGSGTNFGELFAAVQRVGETVIVHHVVNLGRGGIEDGSELHRLRGGRLYWS